jgi:predicted component of type VI protein secretion system
MPPKFLLKFHAAVIKEIPVEKTPLTIGRKPENDIVIDNMAVSGHHARLTLQGTAYVIEDLQSTNGTYVNEKRIVHASLKDNDQIIIGQHILVFVHPDAVAEPVLQSPMNAIMDSEATTVITPQSEPVPAAPAPMPTPAEMPAIYPPPRQEQTGLLRVIEGKSEQNEYLLNNLLTYIGKSATAIVKIKGIFAPDIAALISKRPTGYLITAVKDGYTRLNNKTLSGQNELKDGDVIEAGGIKFLYQLKETPPEQKK